MLVAERPTKRKYHPHARARKKSGSPIVVNDPIAHPAKNVPAPGNFSSLGWVFSLFVWGMQMMKRFMRGSGVRIRVSAHTHNNESRTVFVVPYQGVLLVVLLAVLCGGLWISTRPTQANVAVYAPETCLGGWANPANAQGEVDEEQVLTSSNSALYAGGEQSLYCGNFVGSTIDNAEIESVTLRLAWGRVKAQEAVTEGEYIDAPVLQPETEHSPDPATVVPVQSEKVNEDPAGVPEEGVGQDSHAVEVDLPEGFASGEVPGTSAPNENGEPKVLTPIEQQVSPMVEPPAEPDKPQSSLFKLVRTAHAQDAEAAHAPTTEAADIIDAAEIISQNSGEGSGEQPLFSLKYSLDGGTWTEFGTVNKDRFESEFSVPIKSLEDIRALQVAVVPVNSTNLEYPILLNGMALEFRYISRDKPVAPDPATDLLVVVQSDEQFSLVKTQDAENFQVKLWIYDREGSPQWTPIADGSDVESSLPMLLAFGHAFWVSPDNQSLAGYNIRTKTYFSHSLFKSAAQDEVSALVFEGGRMVRFEEGQLVVRNFEGVIDDLVDNSEQSAEIRRLFLPVVPTAPQERSTETNKSVSTEEKAVTPVEDLIVEESAQVAPSLAE